MGRLYTCSATVSDQLLTICQVSPERPGASPPFVFLRAVLNSCRVGGAVSVASMCSLTLVSESCEILEFSCACVFWIALHMISWRCGLTLLVVWNWL